MNNKNIIKVLHVTVCVSIIFSGCVMNKLDASAQTITLRSDSEGAAARIDIVKGETWSDRMKAGPFIFNVLPQIAVWTEDSSGRLMETLYITGADSKKMRHAAKKEKGEDFYRECLPVWASKMDLAGNQLPSDKNPYPDTVTSVTPSSSFTLNTTIAQQAKPFTIRAEINKSGDTNDNYTDENNDWAGQPSLVYETAIHDTEPGGAYILNLVGHGGMIGERPGVYEDLSGIDTALRQIEEIKVSF